MADVTVTVDYNRAVVRMSGPEAIATMLAQVQAVAAGVDASSEAITEAIDGKRDLTSVTPFQPGQSVLNTAPYGLNIALQESTDGTSNRAAAQIGNNWLLGQDSEGSGTRNFFLYSLTSGTAVLSIDPSTNHATWRASMEVLGGIGGETSLGTIAGDTTPYLSVTADMAEAGISGSNWLATHALRRSYTPDHGDARFTVAHINKSTGSGGNAPAFGAFARLGLSYKDNYLTSSEVGEVGVDYLFYAQGEEGDGSAILIDGIKVGNVGGALGLETSTSTVNTSGSKTMRVKSITAFIESGQVGGFGHLSEAWVGANKAAYIARCHDESAGEAGGPPSWESLFVAYGERGTTDHLFNITGGGTQIDIGPEANRKSLRVLGGVLQFRNADDDDTILNLTDAGELYPLTVGVDGTPMLWSKRVVVALNFPSILAGNTEALTTTVTGAAVGDHVSVASAALDYFDDKLLFSGQITAADTATVRCHNISGSSIDPASQTVTVVVSRYA